MDRPDTVSGDRNRSLQRGIEILRAFRPGSNLYGNGELAERTGLSRATVSRLAQTLVDCGMLEHDRRRRAYRLAPLELTSLGRAYLAVTSEPRRRELLAQFRSRRTQGWSTLSREITSAMDDVRKLRYCWACWQPEVVAIATPIVVADLPIYVLNMSVSGSSTPRQFVVSFHKPLLELADQIRRTIETP